jgi:hypothetical protein
MQLYQMVMQKDDGWATLNELGKINCLHFIDLNKDKMPHELQYSRTIRNLEEVQRKITYVLFLVIMSII